MAKPTANKPAKENVNVTTVRLERAIKDALAQAAWEDRRPSAAKLRLILEDWLLERDYLQRTPQGLVFIEPKTKKPPRAKS